LKSEIGTKSKIKNQKSKIRNKNSSLPRILTALVVLPILIVSILIPWLQYLFVFLAAVAAALGLYEFYLLALRREMKPDIATGYTGAVALFTVFCLTEPNQFPDPLIILTLIIFTVGTLIAATLRGVAFDKMISSSGSTILGVLYVVLLGGYLVSLRTGFDHAVSSHLLSFFFIVLMGADTAAFYVGRHFGKHKLAPKISPGKTWEGVVGGLVAGGALAALCHFWFFPELPLKWALPLGLVMTTVGIFGDLTESALKRGAGAKDAANILPGHGGLLDRLDSLLFNAPLIYYFGRLYFDRSYFPGI
jgi:phosphatidate cytidylyltransferase